MWGNDKPEQKLQGREGTGWLRSPDGSQVVRITSAGETLHAKWLEVVDADVTSTGLMQIRHSRGCVPWSGVKPEACDLIGDQ